MCGRSSRSCGNETSPFVKEGRGASQGSSPRMDQQEPVFARCARRLVPLIAVLYFVNYVDRVNVGFAALTMNRDMSFSPSVYGLGASLFFAGYLLFQIPANVVLERVGARRWIFSIMAVWGALSMATAFMPGPRSFYLLRFCL